MPRPRWTLTAHALPAALQDRSDPLLDAQFDDLATDQGLERAPRGPGPRGASAPGRPGLRGPRGGWRPPGSRPATAASLSSRRAGARASAIAGIACHPCRGHRLPPGDLRAGPDPNRLGASPCADLQDLPPRSRRAPRTTSGCPGSGAAGWESLREVNRGKGTSWGSPPSHGQWKPDAQRPGLVSVMGNLCLKEVPCT